MRLIQVECDPEIAAWVRAQAATRGMPVAAYLRGLILIEWRKRHQKCTYKCFTCGYRRADSGPGKCLNKRHCADYEAPLEIDSEEP